MRRKRGRREDDIKINMTPMLDIVFILLIFFIVTATFLSEQGIEMHSPPGCEDCPPAADTPLILIQVTDQDIIFVNQVRTDLDRVLASAQRFRAESPASQALVEIHDEASHGVVVRIWDDMQANGVPVTIQRRED